MTTIAITGVDGALGRRLVAALDELSDVARIVGVGRHAPQGCPRSKLVFRPADLRDPALVDTFRGVDVLVHLAEHRPANDRPGPARGLDVAGTRAVFDAAAAAGVTQVVHTSSVLAYGAHPDNDVPLTESSPLRGIASFELAEHYLDVERWLDGWSGAHPQVQVATLRFASLLGPGVDSFLTRAFEAPRIPAVRGHRPPLQFLHPADAVSALVHAARHRLQGSFNVAADGWLSFDEVTAIVGRRVVEVPEEVAYSSTERLWSLGLGEQPPGVVTLFVHPCVMSTERLVDTGWSPTHTNRDAVATMAAEHHRYLTMGPVRVGRGAVRWTLAAGVGTTAWLLVRTIRRLRAQRGHGV